MEGTIIFWIIAGIVILAAFLIPAFGKALTGVMIVLDILLIAFFLFLAVSPWIFPNRGGNPIGAAIIGVGFALYFGKRLADSIKSLRE